MQEAHQLRRITINFDDIVSEFNWMAGGETNAVNTVNRSHQAQQFSEGTDAAIKRWATISIHILAE
ncbi:hypothetical protein D3C75_1251390 [compost metagenome]